MGQGDDSGDKEKTELSTARNRLGDNMETELVTVLGHHGIKIRDIMGSRLGK